MTTYQKQFSRSKTVLLATAVAGGIAAIIAGRNLLGIGGVATAGNPARPERPMTPIKPSRVSVAMTRLQFSLCCVLALAVGCKKGTHLPSHCRRRRAPLGPRRAGHR